jgi:hypothetical protein
MLRFAPAIVAAGLAAGCGDRAARGPTEPPRQPRPVAAAAPFVPSLPPPPPMSGPIGTPHPLWLIDASATGKWVAYCQAREDTNGDGVVGVRVGPHGAPYGDRAGAYVRAGDGPEEPIDELVAAAPGGRWFVAARRGRRVLVDGDTGRGTELAPSDRAAGGPLAAREPVTAFDETGERLLYEGASPGPRLHVRELAAGREAAVEVGPGELLGATLAGPWVVATVVARDTNGDGRLSGPREVTTLARGACRGEASSSSHWVFAAGDERVVRAVPAAGGPARDVAGFVGVVGDALLVRGPAGALSLERPGAPPLEVVGAACAGRVLAAHGPTGRLLVACRQGRGRRGSLELHGPDVHEALGEGVEMPDRDRLAPADDRLVALPVDGAALVIDLTTGRRRHFARAEALSARAGRILLRREGSPRGDGTLSIADFGGGAERPVAGTFDRYAETFFGGRFAYVEPMVIDLATGAAADAFRGEAADEGAPRAVRVRPLALAASGHFLMPSPRPAPATTLRPAWGPARWAWPGVAPAAGPAAARAPAP